MLPSLLPCQGQNHRWQLGRVVLTGMLRASCCCCCQWIELLPGPDAEQGLGLPFPQFLARKDMCFLFVCLFLFSLCLLMVLCPFWEHMKYKKNSEGISLCSHSSRPEVSSSIPPVFLPSQCCCHSSNLLSEFFYHCPMDSFLSIPMYV